MGHDDVVKFLLDVGVEPNNAYKFNRTPLYEAAQNGHLDVVRLLIHMQTKLGTPFHVAAEKGREDVEMKRGALHYTRLQEAAKKRLSIASIGDADIYGKRSGVDFWGRRREGTNIHSFIYCLKKSSYVLRYIRYVYTSRQHIAFKLSWHLRTM